MEHRAEEEQSGSPGRPSDLESGESRRSDRYGNENLTDDAFDIPAKNVPVQSLKRWRQAVFVLNAARRFRYTLDLKKEKEKERLKGRIRTHAQVIRAAILFREAGEKAISGLFEASTPAGRYGITSAQLISLTRDHNIAALKSYGGAKGLSDVLKTNLDKGICGDLDISNRRDEFGANTYPQKKGKSFWIFLWEAWQDLTLVILIIAAALSLGLGIKTEGPKEGWYDGGSIAIAVILVIVVTAVSDYRQALQFQSLNEEKRNIRLEVH